MKIKVLQLNANKGRTPNFNDLTSFLKETNADVMLFQEVYDGSDPTTPPGFRLFSVFKNLFPDYDAVFKPAFCDITRVGNIETGNAIFVRGKIKESKNIHFDIPYETVNNEARTDFSAEAQTMLSVKAEVQNVELHLISLHGIWGFDGRDNPRRYMMVDKVITEFSGKENIVLAGDFNLNPDTEAARKIEKHLKSVFGNTLKSTFNMKFKTDPGYATAVVDMIFVSPEITVLEKECPVVDASDHLPLLATLEVT